MAAGVHAPVHQAKASGRYSPHHGRALGQQPATTPVAQSLEGLDRKFSGELGAVPTATRAQFLRIKPQDRAAAAAATREIGAQRNLVAGNRSTESAHYSSKSLFQGAVDGIRWVATGHDDDMDRLLNTTEHKLDRLQHDVMMSWPAPTAFGLVRIKIVRA